MQRHFIYILLIMIGYAPISQAQRITSSGNWTPQIPGKYKVKEAGMDYANGIKATSVVNKSFINVRYSWAFRTWRVSVSSSNIPNNMTVRCRRTGDGISPTLFSSISGGQNYLNISPIQQEFFRGILSSRNIPIQYELNISNLSVTMPVKTYTIDITYTITLF